MDGYKPPFTITNSILSHVASVSEKVGRITVMSNMENKPHLRKNNWIKSDKKPVKNTDLWKKLLPFLKTHEVTMHWLRGHAGHPENERCDELARACASGSSLPRDPGFSSACL